MKEHFRIHGENERYKWPRAICGARGGRRVSWTSTVLCREGAEVACAACMRLKAEWLRGEPVKAPVPGEDVSTPRGPGVVRSVVLGEGLVVVRLAVGDGPEERGSLLDALADHADAWSPSAGRGPAEHAFLAGEVRSPKRKTLTLIRARALAKRLGVSGP